MLQCACSHFPENQLGASLKASRPDTMRYGPFALPREPTRGLIEGRPAPSERFIRTAHFPENQLGASLKGGTFEHEYSTQRNFPENQLGASLKAVRSMLIQQPFFDFPENQLGASLKDDGDENRACQYDQTSPRTNSGPH